MILQSRRVWVLNDWLEAQVEVSAESGRIEGICPYGTCVPDMDFGDLSDHMPIVVNFSYTSKVPAK
jgi:N-acetylglucosamine-6-phosphate deacetylase